MKVAILAGGFGTRISDHSRRPKPMITIGGKPIISHILDIYLHQGFKDFIIAAGYKGEIIKNYFKKNKKKFSNTNIQVVDTGLKTLTGNRLKKLKKYIKDENFMVTYGDGLSNIDLNKLVKFHLNHNKIATVTAVHPPARFGELMLDGDSVKIFEEKPQLQRGWINGGFFVFKKIFLDLIPDKPVMLEREPLNNAAKDGEFMAYQHNNFWYCMDNRRDHSNLEKMCKLKKVPWLKF
jgi:glucose-1-phosphate cytidylyltransferase|tara:strand:- start:1350 stop:2057 length:708 start_codon:yes stop_codon:yes gene_type:complete